MIRRIRFATAVALCACIFATAAGCTSSITTGPTARSHHGAVVSVSVDASKVGVEVLRHGGNAVDATVATAFALAVTFPEAGNIAGGGFMIVRPAGRDATPIVIDYRETAPAAATADLLAGPEPLNQYRMVGVPGTVRGLALAHERFGRRPWRQLIEPAITLAEKGFVLNHDSANSLNTALNRPGEEAAEMRRVLGKPGGGKWVAGDRLVQPELAATLRRIAHDGPDAFYAGPVAQAIVETVRHGGGILTADDLASYRAKIREPIHGTFRGYDIYAPPPPTSGGICLIEMLNILERFDLARQGRWSSQTLHVMIEAMRRVYADRARTLGDSDFVSIPPQLTSKDYAAQLASQIDPNHATPSETLARDIRLAPPREGEHTTHFSVLDASGMAVSNTYTLEQPYGSRIMVEGFGFLLNNEMGDFNRRPGVTDRAGRIGTPPNLIAPGKRMLSSICPTIVTRNGRVVMVTGSPGGRTIINTMLCVLLNRLEFGMPPRETIDAPRMSHTWLPEVLAAESALLSAHADTLSALRGMGHRVIEKTAPGQGDAYSIFIEDDGTIVGVADHRRSGTSAGY